MRCHVTYCHPMEYVRAVIIVLEHRIVVFKREVISAVTMLFAFVFISFALIDYFSNFILH